MPYLKCPVCHVPTYAVAVRFATPDPCPNCGAPLDDASSPPPPASDDAQPGPRADRDHAA